MRLPTLRDTMMLPRAPWVLELARRWRSQKELAIWFAKGQPDPPPPWIKQRLVKRMGRRYRLKTLVESGTYLGEMLAASLREFDHLVSIELSGDLARAAQERFRSHPHVEILEGDSGQILPELLKRLEEPLLFWLDGHYSGGLTAKGSEETPVQRELAAVLRRKATRDVVLVDDARLFTGKSNYPTVEEVRNLVRSWRPERTVTVDHDVIQILPPAETDR